MYHNIIILILEVVKILVVQYYHDQEHFTPMEILNQVIKRKVMSIKGIKIIMYQQKILIKKILR